MSVSSSSWDLGRAAVCDCGTPWTFFFFFFFGGGGGGEYPTPIPGISYASITQSPVKKVTVEDAGTQTDPIPGLKPLEKLKPKNTSDDKKKNSTSQQ